MVKLIRLISLVMILMVVLAGCARNNPDESERLADPKATAEETVTVVLPVPLEVDLYTANAEESLFDQWFPLEFMGYGKNSGYIDNQAYLDYCLDISQERNNVVMFFRSPVPEHNAAGLFEEITEVYRTHAPNHFETYANEEDNYGVATAVNDRIQSHRLAVLVRNEYLDVYQQSIRTASEYEAFLEWADQNLTDGRKPGLIRANLYEKAYHNTYVPFDLFMPEYGYVSLSPALPINIGGLYTGDEQYSVDDVDVFALESLPQFKEAALKLAEWIQDDWIDVVNIEDSLPNIEQYASVVVNPADYATGELAFCYPDKAMCVDATDFSMFILYPDRIPNPWMDSFQPLYHAYVLKGSKNPTAFFSFLEWLYHNEDNYRQFTGSDTGPSDDINHVSTQSAQPWPVLSFFYNGRWADLSSAAPANFQSETEKATNFDHPIMHRLIENRSRLDKIQADFWTHSDYAKISDREKAYKQLMGSLFHAVNENPEAVIDQFIQQQVHTEELVNKIHDLVVQATQVK